MAFFGRILVLAGFLFLNAQLKAVSYDRCYSVISESFTFNNKSLDKKEFGRFACTDESIQDLKDIENRIYNTSSEIRASQLSFFANLKYGKKRSLSAEISLACKFLSDKQQLSSIAANKAYEYITHCFVNTEKRWTAIELNYIKAIIDESY
ncbi:MAG: hypothetical protein R3A80_11095 [Bdellovibrionota bacterium]